MVVSWVLTGLGWVVFVGYMIWLRRDLDRDE